MIPWERKGCPICRRMWEVRGQPPRLGVSLVRQTYLHQCEECGTYWEQHERYADTISSEEAKRFYPEFFKDKPI